MRREWIAMIAALMSFSAVAQDVRQFPYGPSGNDLKAQLIEAGKVLDTGKGDDFLGGLGLGYLEATYEIMIILKSICPDPAVTTGQIRAVVTKFLDDHPAELHLPKSLLTTRAFQAAFPCPDAKKK